MTAKKLLEVLDNMMAGFQIIDQNWRYIYINDAAAKHGHSTKEKLLGKTMMEVYPGIETTEMFSVLIRCMKNRAPAHMEMTRPEKFSTRLNLDHTQLRGRKILCEFDPATPYERVVRDFVLEAQTHGEAVVVLSAEANIVYRVLQREEGLEFFPLTSETIFSQIIDTHTEKHLAIVCDNLTDRIITMGFHSAYNFTKNALDQLIDPKITALFLLNPNAHSSKEVSSIRNLFSEQITYGKDGLTKVKLTLA